MGSLGTTLLAFDLLKKTVVIGRDSATLYFIDGFIKDTVMQKLMMHFLSLKTLGGYTENAADEFIKNNVPHIEADVVTETEQMIQMVLSGAALVLGSSFGRKAIIVDARTYPARETAEPQDDRVMRGSRDGFAKAETPVLWPPHAKS